MGELQPNSGGTFVAEFQEAAVAGDVISLGGLDYASELLRLALGEDKAAELMDRLSATSPKVPFGFLRHLNVPQLVNFLSGEHPQTIALLASFLTPDKAAQVLSGLDPELAAEVAQRIASMDRASPEIVDEVSQCSAASSAPSSSRPVNRRWSVASKCWSICSSSPAA